jgi:phage terminase small subunit
MSFVSTTGLAITDGQTYEAKVNPAIQLASETRMINMACYIGIRY